MHWNVGPPSESTAVIATGAQAALARRYCEGRANTVAAAGSLCLSNKSRTATKTYEISRLIEQQAR